MKSILLTMALILTASWARGANSDYIDTTKLSTAGFINGVNPKYLHPRPVCVSTVTIETDEYVWIYYDGLNGNYGDYIDSKIYDIERTTESVVCGYHCYQNEIGWTKFKKVPHEIEGWHCVEWESCNGCDMNARGLAIYHECKKKCVREVGYRKDGMVVWREKR